MAKEIQFGFPAALNLYAQVLNATGSIYRTDSTAFEAYSTSNYANYNITMTQQGTASQLYMADFPSAIATAGVYTVVVRQRLGGSPAESDPVVGGGVIQWSGSAVLPLSSVTDRLPAALVGGRVDAHIGACGENVLTASALASDVVAEIQSGLSTLDDAGVRSAIGLAAANLDSQIAAIQAQTDQLDFSGDDGMLLSESTNAGGDCPTAGEIAEAVWEHDLSSPHLPQTAAGRVSASYAASAKFETMIIAEGLVYVFTESALQNAPTGVGGGGGSVVVTSPVTVEEVSNLIDGMTPEIIAAVEEAIGKLNVTVKPETKVLGPCSRSVVPMPKVKRC